MRKLTVLFVVLLSGCGFVKVSVNGGGSTRGGSNGSPSDGEAASSDSEEAAALKKAYDDLDKKGACAGIIKELCGTNLRKAAGIETRPHGPYDPVRMWNPREGANPDPEWATGWDKLPDSEGFNEATAVFNYLGATLVMKANRRACEAEYKPKYEAHKKLSGELDGKIDAALKEPTMHERLKALIKLRPGGDLRFVGARFRLEEEIGKLATDPAEQAAFAWIHTVSPDAADIRPLLSYEKEAGWACMKESRSWYKNEELSAAEDEVKKAKSLPTEQKGAAYIGLTESREFKAPFSGIDTAKVVSVARDGNGGTLTLESSREEQIILGCSRSSDRLVVENGAIQRDKSCTYGTKTWANAITLKFTDLPRADIAKGDEVHLLAEITEVSVKATSRTGAKQREDRKFGGKGTMLLSVKHSGNEVWRP